MEKIIPIIQALEKIGCARNTLYKLMNLHGIESTREGNQRFLKKEDYERLFNLYQTTIKKRKKTHDRSQIFKLPKEADTRLEQLIEVAWTERQLNARLTKEIRELKEQIKNLLELNAELVKSNLHLIGSVRHSLDAQTRRQQGESPSA
jgi:transketolase